MKRTRVCPVALAGLVALQLALAVPIVGTPSMAHVDVFAHQPSSSVSAERRPGDPAATAPRAVGTTVNATGNLTASLSRLVFLVGLAASGVVTLVWSRVALSWFSHDPSRKVQAKERARDALIGTLVLLAAVSGLAWGLAHWVLTGT